MSKFITITVSLLIISIVSTQDSNVSLDVSNTATTTSTTSTNSGTDTQDPHYRCTEGTSSIEQCLAYNANCCFVHNTYGSNLYTGCVDVQKTDRIGQETFCNNFFSLSKNDGFTVINCVCNQYTFTAGHYARVSGFLIFLLAFLIL
jgi:hypothetical protein